MALREQAIPLAGSPFTLEVVSGPASALGTLVSREALPLIGVVGLKEEFGAKLNLQACDKVGNACTVGGATVECAVKDPPTNDAGTKVEPQTEVKDLGDGRYALVWRSEISGVFQTQIIINGEPLTRSPPVRFTADAPMLSRTQATGDGLREARAGHQAKVVLRLLDQYGNVALGEELDFGMTLVREGDKEDRNKWKNAEVASDPFEGGWQGEEFHINYVAEKAGTFDLHLWSANKADEAARVAALTADGSTHGGEESFVGKKKSRREEAKRAALPGSPFKVKCRPAHANPKGSVIEGFVITEAFEEKSGKKGASSQQAATSASANDILASDSSVGAGETVAFRPTINDFFGNVVQASKRDNGKPHLDIIVTVPPPPDSVVASTSPRDDDDDRERERKMAIHEGRRFPLDVVSSLRGEVVTYEARYTPKVLC